jgi:hypothetical protein
MKNIRDINSPTEAKQFIINSINPQCQVISKKFFDCLEYNINLSSSQKNLEKYISDIIAPECMKAYNLENCLNKH